MTPWEVIPRASAAARAAATSFASGCGTSTATSNTFTYDGATYWPSSTLDAQYDMLGAVLDASCMSAHAATGDQWACTDRHHVLLNHIATPFMLRLPRANRQH